MFGTTCIQKTQYLALLKMTMSKTFNPEHYFLLGLAPKFHRSLAQNMTICLQAELLQSVVNAPSRSVFISFQNEMTNALLAASLQAKRQSRFEDLVTIEPPRSGIVPPLFGWFETVIGVGLGYRWLPVEEFLAVLTDDDATDRFIGGVVDMESETVVLVRGNLQSVVLTFPFFEPSGNGVRPNYHELLFTDYGCSVGFGDYEASADGILYEVDSNYRRRLNKARTRSEQSFGASLRRLRLQRQLNRHDFPGIASKNDRAYRAK